MTGLFQIGTRALFAVPVMQATAMASFESAMPALLSLSGTLRSCGGPQPDQYLLYYGVLIFLGLRRPGRSTSSLCGLRLHWLNASKYGHLEL